MEADERHVEQPRWDSIDLESCVCLSAWEHGQLFWVPPPKPSRWREGGLESKSFSRALKTKALECSTKEALAAPKGAHAMDRWV